MCEAWGDHRALSLRLSRALEDIGVTRLIVARRRRTWLRREAVQKLLSPFFGSDMTTYNFGSQSEGTTSLGMHSDIDVLFSQDNTAVLLDWSEWQHGKDNLLVVKTEQTPPQHCNLQRLSRDCPLPKQEVEDPNEVVDNNGRVLLTTRITEIFLLSKRKLMFHGPSRSLNKNLNMVQAFPCTRLPAECQFLFRRPRPGHWPTTDMLAQASDYPVLLVPHGYPDSPYHEKFMEWRFSTSLMERLLIFSFNTTQLKVFMLLKIIRKAFIQIFVGNNLSTFHMKTAMMFTIESYPPDIWKEDNIVQCALYCLTTLVRWLKLGRCPHFTISGVNLFVGKLRRPDYHTLLSIFASIMRDNLNCLSQIQMDDLGTRLQLGPRTLALKSRKDVHMEIYRHLLTCYFSTSDIIELVSSSGKLTFTALYDYLLQLIVLYNRHCEPSIEKEAATIMLQLVAYILASALASERMRVNQPITSIIMELYMLSFDYDLMSGRLKFVSMLYCSGQFEAAATVLNHCEGLLEPYVLKRPESERPNEDLLETCLETADDLAMYRTSVTGCVIFTSLETRVVPGHLLYEMYRTITREDALIIEGRERVWIKYAIIDSIPFLYYLQYLTYRELDQPGRKYAVLQNLQNYLCRPGGVVGHVETVCNVLGHCYELENRQDVAWHYYSESLRVRPRNNAANWHLIRLLNQHARQ